MRSSAPLPQRYRVSLRVGYGHFGDGTGLKRLRLRPRDGRAVAHRPGRQQNGFYFLATLDALPRPHNNTRIHHHRKVVMDTNSNVPPWTEIWDGQRFVIDGRRPVNMLAVDGRGPVSTLAGKPFLPFAGGTWQPSGTVRAVDAFLPDTWYWVTVERFDARFTLEISDRFRYGGEATCSATIDAAQHCVWHFNRSASEDATSYVEETPFDPASTEVPAVAGRGHLARLVHVRGPARELLHGRRPLRRREARDLAGVAVAARTSLAAAAPRRPSTKRTTGRPRPEPTR
jgi:hypothetical protein